MNRRPRLTKMNMLLKRLKGAKRDEFVIMAVGLNLCKDQLTSAKVLLLSPVSQQMMINYFQLRRECNSNGEHRNNRQIGPHPTLFML